MSRAIVFTRTKHGADRVVRHLHTRGIKAEAIHGNKSQNARKRALDHFSSNKLGILVATDIASRGIDVDGITHVVNYDLTHEPQTYVHRIGRTARAGAAGAAVSFCDHEEVGNLRAIERLLHRPIPEKKNPLGSLPPSARTPAEVREPGEERVHAEKPARPAKRGLNGQGGQGSHAHHAPRAGGKARPGPAGQFRRSRGEANRNPRGMSKRSRPSKRS
jgi:ATP-dependent RNA helicase RhlE